jgi:hypothetical protein
MWESSYMEDTMTHIMTIETGSTSERGLHARALLRLSNCCLRAALRALVGLAKALGAVVLLVESAAAMAYAAPFMPAEAARRRNPTRPENW